MNEKGIWSSRANTMTLFGSAVINIEATLRRSWTGQSGWWSKSFRCCIKVKVITIIAMVRVSWEIILVVNSQTMSLTDILNCLCTLASMISTTKEHIAYKKYKKCHSKKDINNQERNVKLKMPRSVNVIYPALDIRNDRKNEENRE